MGTFLSQNQEQSSGGRRTVRIDPFRSQGRSFRARKRPSPGSPSLVIAASRPLPRFGEVLFAGKNVLPCARRRAVGRRKTSSFFQTKTLLAEKIVSSHHREPLFDGRNDLPCVTPPFRTRTKSSSLPRETLFHRRKCSSLKTARPFSEKNHPLRTTDGFSPDQGTHPPEPTPCPATSPLRQPRPQRRYVPEIAQPLAGRPRRMHLGHRPGEHWIGHSRESRFSAFHCMAIWIRAWPLG